MGRPCTRGRRQPGIRRRLSPQGGLAHAGKRLLIWHRVPSHKNAQPAAVDSHSHSLARPLTRTRLAARVYSLQAVGRMSHPHCHCRRKTKRIKVRAALWACTQRQAFLQRCCLRFQQGEMPGHCSIGDIPGAPAGHAGMRALQHLSANKRHQLQAAAQSCRLCSGRAAPAQ